MQLDVPSPRAAPRVVGPRGDLVVLVDPQGRPAGVADRLTVHDGDTPLHLGFSCYVVDADDRLLVTRRSLDKRTFPGTWTNSVCGHPAPGESLTDAVRRRAYDELGIELCHVRLVLPEYAYRAEMAGVVENELCPVLVAVADRQPVPDPSEVEAVEWVPWQTFAGDVLAGARAVSPWCEQQVGQLSRLGPPSHWPTADPDQLPPALREASAARGPATVGTLDGLRERIDDALLGFVDREIAAMTELDESVSSLTDAARAAVRGGKRLRATFAYWGWLGAGREPDDRVLSAAAALELLHTFALVHDDVMDGSARRRGQPSAHERLATLHRDAGWSGSAASFGVASAILVGDLCLSWADRMLYRCGLAEETLARAKPVYDSMRTELVAGQYLDLLAQARQDTCSDLALRVARHKTAGYTAERPLLMGAALAGAEAGVVETYQRYGSAVGLAYQLRDDVLGVFGDPAVTGKPSGDDIREGKRTVLVTRALEWADPAGRAVLDRSLGAHDLDDSQLAEVREVLVDTGALDAVECQVRALAADARTAVAAGGLPPTATAVLLELVDRMTLRDR